MSLFPKISSNLGGSWYPSLQADVNGESNISAQQAVHEECTVIVRSVQPAGHKRSTLDH